MHSKFSTLWMIYNAYDDMSSFSARSKHQRCYNASFMCLTSMFTHVDDYKSFMKFGAKKSHEIMSYIIAWIALVSEWNYRSSTKLCNLAQRTLIELYNKSYEGFMLSRYQENVSIGLKL